MTGTMTVMASAAKIEMAFMTPPSRYVRNSFNQVVFAVNARSGFFKFKRDWRDGKGQQA
jgi:hypothetical protein